MSAGDCRIGKLQCFPDDKILVHERGVLRDIPQRDKLSRGPEHIRVNALDVGRNKLEHGAPDLIETGTSVVFARDTVRHHKNIAVHLTPLKRGNDRTEK